MSGNPAPRERGSVSLGTRLLAAQVLVVLSAALTAWLVGSAVAPPLFHRHMHAAMMSSEGVTDHAEQAFRSANAISLSMALLAALVTSVAASAYLARRVNRVVAPLAAAADRVARGDYDTQVALPGLGAEFDRLTAGFNQMAGRLALSETTRRRMLGDLAHELRTPVAVLDAYLEALEDGVSVPDAETIGLLRDQTARMARLAQDVSALSRAEEGRQPLQLRVVEAEHLASLAVAAARSRFEAKGVRLEAQVEPEARGSAGSADTTDTTDSADTVAVDIDRIGQVLGNLLDNALRHSPAGSVVRVLAGRDPDGVRLRVVDEGDGIAAEHLPHVFERFYRADQARDRAHGGSGIGLAIVKALVEQHGGTVDVDSPGPGRGTTFSVVLPAAEADRVPPAD